jgi:hypothetical protein
MMRGLLWFPVCSITQRYAHLRDQALRQAADLARDIIEQITSGPTDSGVQVYGDSLRARLKKAEKRRVHD